MVNINGAQKVVEKEMNIKDIGKKEKEVEMESIFMRMEQFMKVKGKTMIKMVMVLKYGERIQNGMEINMKVNGKKENQMVKVRKHGQMVLNMMENGKMVKNMVMVYINGENKLINMEKNIMVYGIMINVEEKGNIFIRMVLFMKENLKIIYIMDMVLKHGEVILKETERNMKVIGKMER